MHAENRSVFFSRYNFNSIQKIKLLFSCYFTLFLIVILFHKFIYLYEFFECIYSIFTTCKQKAHAFLELF